MVLLLKFVVPGRAVPYVRTTYRQKFVDPYYARYQDYKTLFGVIAKHASKKNNFFCDKGERVKVDISVYLRGRRRIDIDNIFKSIFDSCNGQVWNDDSQVEDVYIKKQIGLDKEADERVEMTIKKIEE